MIGQVGFENEGPYKSEYPKIRVRDNLEPLVDISNFGLVSSDYYLTEYLSGRKFLQEAIDKGLLRSTAYLRKTHAQRLQKVDAFLRKNDLFLHVQSGWRHPQLQKLVKQQYEKEYGAESANRLFAPVLKDAAPPPHATGAAFDLEIRSLIDGQRQELYWTVNNKNIYGAYELEQLLKSNEALRSNPKVHEIVANRRILFHCLCSKGVVFQDDHDLFTPHPGECWHFGDGDPLSAYLRREGYARYGYINPHDQAGQL